MTTTTAHQPMTFHEILATARLIDGARHGRKVTWAVGGDVTSLIEDASLRYIEPTNQATGERAATGDVRDMFLRITATFEHWLPVSEVLALMDDGLFVIHEEGK